MFGVKLRIVDTAGIDDFEENKKYDEIINKTIEQTRKGLIYSDLALFLIDARKGITFIDIKLANWINKVKKIQAENQNFEKNDSESIEKTINIKENNNNSHQQNEDIDDLIIKEYENKDEKLNIENNITNKFGKENQEKNKTEREIFYDKLKQMKLTDEIKIPPVILIANKTENNFVPDDVFCDFIKLNLGEPLLISAEHGDNMVFC